MALSNYQSVHHVTGLRIGPLQFQTGAPAPDLWVRTITVDGSRNAQLELTLFADKREALLLEPEPAALTEHI